MKSDRRVKYTQRVLKESLLEILKDRPIERVTVKEICDRADINRSTFYVHYGSPHELLDSIINELYDEIKTKKKDFTDIKAYTRQISEIIYEYRDLMFVLLKAGHMEQLFQMAALWKEDFIGAFTRMNMPAQRIEAAYLYITCGSFACIYTWVLGGFDTGIDEIADEVYKLTAGALSNFSREEDKDE